MWRDKPFSKGQAWLDLLFRANWKDNKAIYGSQVKTIPRGSFFASQRELAQAWGWSRAGVRRFIELLRFDGMIITDIAPKAAQITIVNYEQYQIIAPQNEPKAAQSRPNRGPKSNKGKIKFKEYVYLTEEEHKRMVDEFGKEIVNQMIELLDNYIGAMPRKRNKYTDHNRVLRGWPLEKVLERQKVNGKKRDSRGHAKYVQPSFPDEREH